MKLKVGQKYRITYRPSHWGYHTECLVGKTVIYLGQSESYRGLVKLRLVNYQWEDITGTDFQSSLGEENFLKPILCPKSKSV